MLLKLSTCDRVEAPVSCGAWAETREPPKDQFVGAGARGIKPGPKTSCRSVDVRIIRSLTAVGPLAFNMSLKRVGMIFVLLSKTLPAFWA